MVLKKRAELEAIVKRAREEHKRIFGEELAMGELNHFFTSLLEFKRRKWIEAALGDFEPEEIITFIEVVDDEQGEDGQATNG